MTDFIGADLRDARFERVDLRGAQLRSVESIDGSWSFIETLRHLAFATDSWVERAILGDPSPWDALDLPWDEMPDTAGVPRDRDVRTWTCWKRSVRRGGA